MGKYRLYDVERDRTMELELTASQLDELKRFLKDLNSPPEIDYKRVIENYNRTCKSLPPATRLTSKRKRAIAAALKEGYDLDELFRNTAASRFLNGDNKQGWRASLDWLLIPSNALKVMEGHYDTSASAQPLCASSIEVDEVMSNILSKYKN